MLVHVTTHAVALPVRQAMTAGLFPMIQINCVIRQCGESLGNRRRGEEWSNCCAIVWKSTMGPLHVRCEMFSKKTDIMCARRVSTTNRRTVAVP